MLRGGAFLLLWLRVGFILAAVTSAPFHSASERVCLTVPVKTSTPVALSPKTILAQVSTLSLAALLSASVSLAQTAAPSPTTPVQTAPTQTTPVQTVPTPAAPTPTTPVTEWTASSLTAASYAIQEPVWEGSTSLVSAEQRQGIVDALKRDSAGAIKRRYPNAQIVASTTPGAIKVTPGLVAPTALVPWAKLTARLSFELPSGQKMQLEEAFGLLNLWQKGAEAANFAFDQLAKRLP